MKFLEIFPISILGNIMDNLSDLDMSNYKDFLLKQAYDSEGKNGESTYEQKILEYPIFSKLKNSILKLSKEYLVNQGHIFEDVQIISSWGNKINNQESIHSHTHPNSYISGVFYFNNSSPIRFFNPSQNLWTFKPLYDKSIVESKNLYSCLIEPQPKLLLMFPSFLSHSVIPLKSSTPRLSIAFNIIPKGEFGEKSAKLYL